MNYSGAIHESPANSICAPQLAVKNKKLIAGPNWLHCPIASDHKVGSECENCLPITRQAAANEAVKHVPVQWQ